jgi:hypothetical protein
MTTQNTEAQGPEVSTEAQGPEVSIESYLSNVIVYRRNVTKSKGRLVYLPNTPMLGESGRRVFPEKAKAGDILYRNYLTEEQLSEEEAVEVKVRLRKSNWSIQEKIILFLSQKMLVMDFGELEFNISKMLGQAFASISFTSGHIDQIAIQFYTKYGYPIEVKTALKILRDGTVLSKEDNAEIAERLKQILINN